MTYNYKMLFITIAICICMVVPVTALSEESTVNESLEVIADEQPITPVETPAPEETQIITEYIMPPPISDGEPIDDGCGELFIHVLVGHNIFSKEMIIQRINDSNTRPFANGDKVMSDQFPLFEKVGDNTTIELNAIGQYDGRYSPGTYGIILKDGMAGQPEYAIAQVTHKYSTIVNFMGHGVTFVDKPTPKPVTPSSPECPTVYSFDWIRNSNNLLFKFNIENTAIVNKWVTLQYVVKYDRQIRCLEDNRLIFDKWQGPQKCYEPTTITETLIFPRYAPIGNSYHIGVVDYTGVHKNEILQSVSIISCFNDHHNDPKEVTPS